MFVHRGMFDAAATEGEVVGVMAHELSHVLLRHGTANASKAQNPWLQLGQLAGAVGGAVVGGAAGSAIAQGSQFGLGTLLLKYSRDYEKQADLLGAQIMARAGYDPRAARAHVRDDREGVESQRRRRAAVDEQPPESGQPHALHHQGSRAADNRARRPTPRVRGDQDRVRVAAAGEVDGRLARGEGGAGGGEAPSVGRHARSAGARAVDAVSNRQRRQGLPGGRAQQLDQPSPRAARSRSSRRTATVSSTADGRLQPRRRVRRRQGRSRAICGSDQCLAQRRRQRQSGASARRHRSSQCGSRSDRPSARRS